MGSLVLAHSDWLALAVNAGDCRLAQHNRHVSLALPAPLGIRHTLSPFVCRTRYAYNLQVPSLKLWFSATASIRRDDYLSRFLPFRCAADKRYSFGVSCGFAAGPEYHLLMKVATGTVVKGTILVDESAFKDGTDVFILTREPEVEVHLSPEELAELEAGIAEVDRGEMIPGDEFFASLRRCG